MLLELTVPPVESEVILPGWAGSRRLEDVILNHAVVCFVVVYCRVFALCTLSASLSPAADRSLLQIQISTLDYDELSTCAI